MKIDVVANFTPYTAIGWVAEQVFLALHKRGHSMRAVGVVNEGQWDSHVSPVVLCNHDIASRPGALQCWVGPMAKSYEAARNSIVVTGWESDNVPAEYVQPLNKAKAVLVWGQWTASVLQKAKLDVPVAGFPLGVDMDTFCPSTAQRPRHTTFLVAGRTAHGRARKGVDLAMLAFLYAFPADREEVVMQIKLQPDCPLTQLRSGRIQVFTEWLAPQHMADWYRQGTAFVCASSGEGWGLHAHEALACGVPLIAPAFGGITEFFQPDVNGWKVTHKLVAAKALHTDAGRWAQVDFYSLVAQMQYVHENPIEAAVYGLRGAASVAKLTTKHMHSAIGTLVERYGQ